MNNSTITSPFSLTLLGPTKNDRILMASLNRLPTMQMRRALVGLIMEFTERISVLLRIPPTPSRMSHALHFVDLEYAFTLAKISKRVTEPELYSRIIGCLRTRRKSVSHRLVNSMKMMSYKELMSQLPEINDSDILAVYPYGSRVYGTSKPISDYDFIIITKNLSQDTISLTNHVHATLYSHAEYIQRLDEHEISILECMSLPQEMMVKCIVHPQLAEIDSAKLRVSISSKSSNSWVKAMKKIKLYDDKQSNYIGLKSLFHSLRMIRFGIQIITHGKIVDFGECNELYDQMLNDPLDWDYLSNKYKPIHNSWMSEFQTIAPLTV